MEQAESNPDSPRVFTREKWFVQLGMAACGIACCSKCGISGGQCELPDYVNSASRGLRYAHAVRRSCVAAINIVQPHFSASAASREEERDASVHHFHPRFLLAVWRLSFSCSRIGSFYSEATSTRHQSGCPTNHVLARQGHFRRAA